MSLHRLGARLTRLEHAARRVVRVADVQEVVVRLLAEASTEVGLAPLSVQALCSAWGAFGHSDVSRSRCWYRTNTCASVLLYFAQRSASI